MTHFNLGAPCRTFLRLALVLVVTLIIVAVIAYADGASLPVNHSVSVEGTVPAPPARVFAIITDVANGPSWRKEVKSVQVLPPESGPNGPQDHWIENLGHGVKMNFLALRTEPINAAGNALRVVDLKDPQYGGSWTYTITPSDTPAQTHLHITEDGYINPPIYRFIMVHIFGMTKNLDQYMKDIQTAATRPGGSDARQTQ